MRFPTRFHLLCSAALLAASVAPAAGQDAGMRPLPPPSDSVLRRVAEQVKVPEGFEMTLFAAPPHVIYPVGLEAAPTGELFVAVDPNLNFDRVKGRGRILRVVDDDRDGVADRYSVFADSVDSPRGMVFDGGTLYVAHAPWLSALRDTDGDGVADRHEVLVSGLGFGLDALGGDHTINGMVLGVDGWLYVAVGDYGFVRATGRDGARLQLRGGGVVRVRPDGTGLEVYARGTRNIYDLALDPFLNVFARDNNNNGQGWDVRLQYLPAGADLGYPSLFRHFPEEVLAPIADYGAGAGTAALWVHDPAYPEGLGNTLYTADWGLNRVFRHPLRPSGAGFAAEQEEFLAIPRPSDMVLDGASNLFVASLSGGSFTYAGDSVGYVVRLRPTGAPTGEPPALDRLSDERLVQILAVASAPGRLAAQREILRRGPRAATVRRLERLALGRGEAAGRVAALFTLKQMLGPRSHPVLLRAARDPAVRAAALRALADRRDELTDVSTEPFLRALADPDPRVRLQAVRGLARLGATDAADATLPLAAGGDPVVAHVAAQALVEMDASGAALRALDAGDPALADPALRVLRRLHSPEVVSALLQRAGAPGDETLRLAVLEALARLYHREAEWTGGWWDVQPDTRGPYHEPAEWSESGRIRPVLAAALMAAEGERLDSLSRVLVRNRVLPRESEALLAELAKARDARRPEVVRALVGRGRIDARLAPVLAQVAEGSPALWEAVSRMVVAENNAGPESEPLMRRAALDRSFAPDLRVRALGALGRLPERDGVVAAAEAYAALLPELEAQPALQQAWRRFATERRHTREVGYFAELARGNDEARRVLGYAVLVQLARASRVPEEVARQAASAVDAAWADRGTAASLVRAIDLVDAEEQYAERLRKYRDSAGGGTGGT